MIKEENGLKKRLVESLEHSIKQCSKLSKELGMKYDEPDSRLALIKLEHALRGEARLVLWWIESLKNVTLLAFQASGDCEGGEDGGGVEVAQD